MKIEHFALNVGSPVEMAVWYVQHLGMHVARNLDRAPYTHFLVDESGNAIFEIYCNPTDQVPDYPAMDTLLLHLAFVSTDPTADKERLLTAGATVEEELHMEDGSHLVMMRDPWGLAIQLCLRGKPLLNPVVESVR